MDNLKPMELFGKNLDRDVVVVAEIGVNHEGNAAAAVDMIALAANAGADAVKFQTYTPERYTSASDPGRLERVKRFALEDADHHQLAEAAAKHGIGVFSTPLTEDVVPMLDRFFPVFKIASGDVTFEPVIRAAARTGKPLILSTGAATVEEIDRAVTWIDAETENVPISERLVLMHCVSAYPAPIEEANLRAIPYLAERYEVKVGYSNHVIGHEACFAAIALGAAVVEVHFTDRKSGRDFRDHELSFEPDDLAELVRRAPLIRSSLGQKGKPPQPSEEAGRALIRKGVVAARDLAAGRALSGDDLAYARPATEFAAAQLPTLIGRRLLSAVGKGELIARENLADT
jgi:N,N'-diacetyllegionaminate synthase